MKNIFYSLVLVVLVSLSSCGDPVRNLDVDVSSTALPQIKIKRYEQAMFRIPADSFLAVAPKMQDEYPIFLQGDITDTAALIELKSFFVDPYMVELYQITMDQFPSLDMVEDKLSTAMQHYYHYFPHPNHRSCQQIRHYHYQFHQEYLHNYT